ncbi:molybdopterin-dependent oxidoreductase [Candidatus Nitrotoga arctica]|uniref:Oxidoreductase n=1 Tax=Candidatus Nitrotoga arctica TaxID=453162 RepID=A0ABM8YX24_9PROT|nr:molybdopterin-dependent oxidoreductase [Candidatus Nitrotoga arctica]CAG9932067.1 Oxidoreductase [Candidatus Nitrotoga arctica]
MTNSREVQTPHDSLEMRLTTADDRIRLSDWTPPQAGVVPRLHIGKRWVNVLWIIPIVTAILIIGVAVCQGLRAIPAVQEFIARYPGTPASAPAVYSGFPWWLRLQHFFNLFFMVFIIRAGIQILADHPRLYWKRDCTPGTEWFRFQKEVPRNRIWTSKNDSVTIPKWLGIPGIRHSIGLARWWHFSFNLLWVINGTFFFILLFTTDQWQRLVPTTWAVFPNALSTTLQYWSLNFPVEHAWTRYNSLQQLTYFITVFIAAPLAIITGLMQGPAIANKLGWFAKILNRQAARTIHFFLLCWFLLYIFTHVTLVFITGMRQNLGYMFAGRDNNSWEGFIIFCAAMLLVIVTWVLASPFTIKHARLVQKVGHTMIGPIKGMAEWWSPGTEYSEKDISPYFWLNGRLPDSDAFNALMKDDFANYSLRVSGLVENPREFSYVEIKVMPKQEQITEHFCIQGWSGVAKWGGVPMRLILDIVKPTSDARYAVFYSFSEGSEGGGYYDVHKIENMRHALTILAYEMNGAPISVLYGAPLRLRCENELGFKMVKWIAAIEFVHDFADLGAGEGGYNEDHEFYGYRMPI